MVVRYPEIDLNTIYNNMYEVVRFGDVAQLLHGYYSKYGKIFRLTDCVVREDQRIDGYSRILQQRVIIEREAVRPLILSKEVDDFIDADIQDYTTYIITADHNDENFVYNYPLAAKYLTESLQEIGYDYLDEIETVVRPSIREAMDKKKLIVSTTHDICHAMLDEKTHLVPTVGGSYLCTFPEEDRRSIAGYMAILNSKTFSYIFNAIMHDQDKRAVGHRSILQDIPVPRFSKHFAILENLSNYLLYLSKPNLHPISRYISNERIGYYLTKILDMLVYELYFPEYVYERNLNAIEYIGSAPFMQSEIVDEEHIWETYLWFQRPDNVIRQMIEVLDTRSPELLYKIQQFNQNE